jgi:hypothetical protein
MRLIRLRGIYAVPPYECAMVDDEDFDFLNGFFWKAKWNGSHNHVYAVREQRLESGMTVTVRMHREVLGLARSDKRDVDHINHDSLDNRRHNLRACTHQVNMQNMRVVECVQPCAHCGVEIRRTIKASGIGRLVCVDCKKANAIESAKRHALEHPYAPKTSVSFVDCQQCGTSFVARYATAMFCSTRCRYRAKYERNRERGILPWQQSAKGSG